MSSYLEEYAGGEIRAAKRERIVKWLLIVIALCLVTAGVDWILARLGKANLSDFREQRQASKFFDALRARDYDGAYRLWGCDPARPCRDYGMDKFMEDWGPHGLMSDTSNIHTDVIRHCQTGIIETVRFGKSEPVNLFVNSADLVVGFAPWPVCEPRWQAP